MIKPRLLIKEKLIPQKNKKLTKRQKMKSIAAFIRETLTKREMSQSKLARKLNRHRPEITKWLTGKHNFTIQTLFEIEDALDIDFFVSSKN